jgi:protein TonB
MLLVIRVNTRRMRVLSAFALSATLHGSVLAWVTLASLIPEAHPSSIYEQEIRPNRNRIIWYSLSERLPNITPQRQGHGPARAQIRFHQAIVAGARDNQRPPQLIYTPAPEIRINQMLPAPNVVALAPAAKPLRAFHAPTVAAHIETPSPALPDAPKLATDGIKSVPLPPIAHPQARAFTPPTVQAAIVAKPMLPAAPQFENRLSAQSDVMQAMPLARAVRSFAMPAKVTPRTPTAALPEAPAVSGPRSAEAAYAIVGLLPQRELPAEPKASQKAGFSGAPAPRPEGAETTTKQSQLTVPGLFVESASPQPDRPLLASIDSPTSRRNLAVAARAVPVAADPRTSAAKRVPAPDASLEGRLVYAIAIQMPNVSSFSGSWMVWFAERDPGPVRNASDLAPPVPMRKVDPKYIPAAADERVEGRVRVAAVIRRSGRVEQIELLQRLDSRLDASSLEALAKWEFTPASIRGVPVDVDAIFEIPFHLSPKSSK